MTAATMRASADREYKETGMTNAARIAAQVAASTSYSCGGVKLPGGGWLGERAVPARAVVLGLSPWMDSPKPGLLSGAWLMPPGWRRPATPSSSL